MRHAKFPIYAAALGRIRVGQATNDDIAYINNIAYRPNDPDFHLPSSDDYAPIIVGTNNARREFNMRSLLNYARVTNQPIHCFPATIERQQELSVSTIKYLRNLPDNQTEGLPTMLFLVQGMPIMHTRNTQTTIMLANGTVGRLLGFQTHPSDQGTIPPLDPNTGISFIHHKQPPALLWLQVHQMESHQFHADWPIGAVPVLPTEDKISTCTSRLKLTIHQVPIIPAFSVTVDKSQGMTVNAMAMGQLRDKHRTNTPRQALYVALSRVRNPNQLRLMEPLTMQMLEKFKPDEKFSNIEQTLRNKAEQTLHRLNLSSSS
jgi:hypothetical protein